MGLAEHLLGQPRVGMRAAFVGQPAEPRTGESILWTIEASSGEAPRVLLREIRDDETPVVKPGSSEAGGDRREREVVDHPPDQGAALTES